MMPTSVGMIAAFKSWSVSEVLVMREPLIAYECMMWKAYLESVYMFVLLLPSRVRALVNAISSAFWEEVPEGRDWDSIISVSETLHIQLSLFLLMS